MKLSFQHTLFGPIGETIECKYILFSEPIITYKFGDKEAMIVRHPDGTYQPSKDGESYRIMIVDND